MELITIAVVLYGVLEYFRREKMHRRTLEYAREHHAPPPVRTGPPLWKLLTTSVVGAALLGFIVWLVILGVPDWHPGLPFLLIASGLAPIVVILGLMLWRDLKAYGADGGDS